MATYYVNSGAGGANTGGSWTDAYLTFAQAVTAATAAGDIIKVHYTHQENLTASPTTYTFTANVLIFAVDKDSSDAPTQMGTGGWLGSSTNNITLQFNASHTDPKMYFYGLTLRNGLSSSNQNINIFDRDGAHAEMEYCYFWVANTGGASRVNFGHYAGSTRTQQGFTRLKKCTFRMAAAAQRVVFSGFLQIEGGALSSAGVVTTSGFLEATRNSCTFRAVGFDLSYLGSNTIVNSTGEGSARYDFVQCKLGTAFTVLATQSPANRSSSEVYLLDCASDDTHGLFGYYNAFGSVVSDTGIYVTSGAAAQSWKIVTTANCSLYTPFETPWLGYYNTVTTAITPYVEILRDGSTTAYQDDEVWLDVMAKTNTGSTQSALTTDRMTLLGTPANQDAGAGLGSWTGESGTAWSGKLQVASLTPAEVGHIQARIVVGEPSITVYADPQVRT